MDGISQELCPGRYCGRTILESGNYSECGACDRGYRAGIDSVCRKCVDQPLFYDWLYLGFMAMLVPALHWFFIDFTNKRKNGHLLILHVSALVESIVGAVCTLLVLEPRGSMTLLSCKVERLADWYAWFLNPSPDYVHTLHCSQEAVYPLYTVVLVYYAFCLVSMVLLRPLLSTKLVMNRGTKSIYAALYFFPVLMLVQSCLSGLIYYAFPYMLLVVSVVTNAIHFSFFKDQSIKNLLKQNFLDPRNLTILLGHWLLHAYGIISVTLLERPTFHGPMLLLVPVPSIFYLVTVKFTDPKKLESVGE